LIITGEKKSPARGIEPGTVGIPFAAQEATDLRSLDVFFVNAGKRLSPGALYKTADLFKHFVFGFRLYSFFFRGFSIEFLFVFIGK
jgi:hypothetical protein